MSNQNERAEMPKAAYKREYEATHVCVKLPAEVLDAVPSDEPDRRYYREQLREAWAGPMQIVLDTGARVWVAACYSHELHPEMKRVGQEDGNGYDCHGHCVLSIPSEWCTFINDQEAEDVVKVMEVDAELLRHAL
jgi:hypothetical protein